MCKKKIDCTLFEEICIWCFALTGVCESMGCNGVQWGAGVQLGQHPIDSQLGFAAAGGQQASMSMSTRADTASLVSDLGCAVPVYVLYGLI